MNLFNGGMFQTGVFGEFHNFPNLLLLLSGLVYNITGLFFIEHMSLGLINHHVMFYSCLKQYQFFVFVFKSEL